MQKSRYAPKTPLENLKQSREEKFAKDKDKAARLLIRVQWKAETLMESYARAAKILISEEQNGHSNGHSRVQSVSLDTRSKQAEAMFKVDFFEFYTLLERYITICLAILNVYISSVPARTNVNALRFITNPEWAKTRPEASHAYHANLLDALNKESCPLYASLGNPEVMAQLALAKDYRNAWKDLDIEKSSEDYGHNEERKNIRLQDLDLQIMLELVVTGCIHAHGTVQSHSGPDLNKVTSKDFEPSAFPDMDANMEDIPFEYMDDAMDLD
ncbi:hypothetical protein DM02DRAFT_326602 [Periconia macrospinosa]|uniref:Uncharacterized protein n=1 Tax=Periconia macrospinosa TaxID=97972 RepID=A0A2V1EAN3_9PLEO|nr:hypothetical protein DM02DRAFT_326602 [Periconia macrospinosa]